MGEPPIRSRANPYQTSSTKRSCRPLERQSASEREDHEGARERGGAYGDGCETPGAGVTVPPGFDPFDDSYAYTSARERAQARASAQMRSAPDARPTGERFPGGHSITVDARPRLGEEIVTVTGHPTPLSGEDHQVRSAGVGTPGHPACSWARNPWSRRASSSGRRPRGDRRTRRRITRTRRPSARSTRPGIGHIRGVVVNPLIGQVNHATGIHECHGGAIGLTCPGRVPSYGWGVTWNR